MAFYSLQTGDRGQDLKQLPADVTIEDLGQYSHDFGDLALLLDQLDLVISIDTAVIHLAGAMGKPVWTLLAYYSDWRWMLEGDTTPWYPTMRLFRQTQPGDWTTVMEQCVRALEHKAWLTP